MRGAGQQVAGAKAFMAAAVLPGAKFTMGAHLKLFDAGGFAGITGSALFYDVAPDDKRFVFFRPATRQGPAGADKLVQVTNWAGEVKAKLAGKVAR